MKTRIWGAVFLIVGVALCVFGMWQLVRPAQYRATARIKVWDDSADPTPTSRSNAVQAQIEIIRSEKVLGRVAGLMGLNTNWADRYGQGAPLKSSETVQILNRHLDLRPVTDTSLLEITFVSDDPFEAARFANMIARVWDENRSKSHAIEDSRIPYYPPVFIIDIAEPPTIPFSPNRPLGTAILVCGLGLSGVGIRRLIKGRSPNHIS